jgi:murein DD-endopeptidase MepM/ murein hydrolase activator NlpD
LFRAVAPATAPDNESLARDEDACSLTRHATTQRFPRSRTDRRSRLLIALLAVPFLVGMIAAPASSPAPVQADELADAQAQQRALAQKIADQKRLIAQLNSSQANLQGAIAQTKTELNGITDDLAATRRKVTNLVGNINEIKATYQTLVSQQNDLDLQVQRIEAQETAKKLELGARKAELAQHVRDAYEAERTSMLETFLSGASFTDLLAEMSSQLDVADQDRALAAQVQEDQATLLSLHATVVEARAATNTIRQQTAVQKQKLDQRLGDLRDAQAHLRLLERQAKAALAAQRAQYARMAADAAKLRHTLAVTAAAKRRLQHRIDHLVASQFNKGNIPSQYNGTLRWPMGGTVTQSFGCTGVVFEPPMGNCSHWHNGIDIVAPYGTAVHASGAGRVVYVGWNYADGADPAWIVIIAHSSSLTTWYAHMQSRYVVRAGQIVHAGQTIGYEGNTGHSTGAHLHWMVEFDGNFVNPKLFT